MKHFGLLLRSAIVLGAICTAASGSILLNVSSGLASTDPTQLGRLSRSGVPSDWSASKPFPGILNPSTIYHYTTFALNVRNTSYVQISVGDPTASFFASAYLGSYVPNLIATNRGLDTNYLGDEGSSGDAFGTDPGFFQVVVPMNSTLVLVMNEPVTNAGIGRSFNLLVEGFTDTSFSEPVPEPATILLSVGGLGLMVVRWRRKANANLLQ